MESPHLVREFEFFLKNQSELVKIYNGTFIAIKDENVLGFYESLIDAYTETQKLHELGTFLIQYVDPGTDSYTQTFHSRVSLWV